jgi:hypothetical protein
MYHINLAKAALVISQTMALFLTTLSYPANGQGFNFVDLNQANQFFSDGNKQFEQEIEQFGETWKLPTIKLPQGYHQPESLNQSSFIDREGILRVIANKLKPVTETTIDFTRPFAE